jgi:hypothetical protein
VLVITGAVEAFVLIGPVHGLARYNRIYKVCDDGWGAGLWLEDGVNEPIHPKEYNMSEIVGMIRGIIENLEHILNILEPAAILK